jgi:hypothetical protein
MTGINWKSRESTGSDNTRYTHYDLVAGERKVLTLHAGTTFGYVGQGKPLAPFTAYTFQVHDSALKAYNVSKLGIDNSTRLREEEVEGAFKSFMGDKPLPDFKTDAARIRADVQRIKDQQSERMGRALMAIAPEDGVLIL